jgi:hypothetical protein
MPKIILFLFFFACLHFSPAIAEVITYKQPDSKMTGHNYKVQVCEKSGKWLNAGVYMANVAYKLDTQHLLKKTSFSYFDCSDNVNVRVVVNYTDVKTATVRPSGSGIIPKISGNTIEFSMKATDFISLEINGDIFSNLQIFANTVEKDKPNPNAPNVIYYGPGVHNIGRVNVASGKTIYIAGGAIVQGDFILDHVKNITIRGRGILTQYMVQPDSAAIPNNGTSSKTRDDQLLIEFCENVAVNGIIEVPRGYSVLVGQSKNIRISDFKAFSSSGNADGIDIFCSNDVRIDRIFMRNSDDCIAIYGHRWKYYGNTSGVQVDNAILWADVAHPVLIGTHGDSNNPDTLEHIRFRNIDILNQHENQLDYQGCMALNAGDSNLLRDINFDHVNIADIRKGQLFNLRVMFNRKYNTSAGAGIENIKFSNVTYNGTYAGISIIAGYDELHGIKNIEFENLKINGIFIYDTMKGKPGFYKTGDMANIFIGEHVNGIRFISTN